jgi:hypothetical protein
MFVTTVMMMMMLWLVDETYSLTWDPNHGRDLVYPTFTSFVVVVGGE